MANKIIIILVTLFLAYGCNKPQLDSKSDNYSIFTKSYSDYESADKYKTKLSKIIKDSIYIRELSGKDKNYYGVFIGNYEYNYFAGLRAYELVKDSIINSYQIFKGDSVVTDRFRIVPFLSYYNNLGAIFAFDLFKKNYSLIWANKKVNIISLNADNEYQNIYFFTGKKGATATGYPIFKDVVLYKFYPENSKVKKMDTIGNFVQIFTDIIKNNALQLVYLKFDEKDSFKLEKVTSVYTPEGVKVESKFETFNLINENLPQLTTILINVKSNLNKYFIEYTYLNNETKIFFKDLNSKERKYVTSTDFKMKKIDWTYEDRYCIMYLEKLNNDMITNRLSSMLIIYDTKMKEMINVLENPNAISYILRGDFLFYDTDYNNVKKIVVWDLDKKSIYHEIITEKGCGLKTLKIIE